MSFVSFRTIMFINEADCVLRSWYTKYATGGRSCTSISTRETVKLNVISNIPCCIKYWAVARIQVGKVKLLAAYSAGRYNRLDPHKRTSSTRSLSLSESLLTFSRNESLMLRIFLRSRRSAFLDLTTGVWDEDVRLKSFLDSQLPCLSGPSSIHWFYK